MGCLVVPLDDIEKSCGNEGPAPCQLSQGPWPWRLVGFAISRNFHFPLNRKRENPGNSWKLLGNPVKFYFPGKFLEFHWIPVIPSQEIWWGNPGAELMRRPFVAETTEPNHSVSVLIFMKRRSSNNFWRFQSFFTTSHVPILQTSVLFVNRGSCESSCLKLAFAVTKLAAFSK